VAIEETPDNRGREALAAIGDQSFLDFQQRDIWLATNESEQIVAMRVDPVGTAISACGGRGHRPCSRNDEPNGRRSRC
jgi:hypothetical protein